MASASLYVGLEVLAPAGSMGGAPGRRVRGHEAERNSNYMSQFSRKFYII